MRIVHRSAFRNGGRLAFVKDNWLFLNIFIWLGMLVVSWAIFFEVIRNVEQIFHWSIRGRLADLRNAIGKWLRLKRHFVVRDLLFRP